MHSTAKIASFVIFILIGASVFSLVFRGVNGDLWVEHLLIDLPGGQLGFLIVVNILVFLLAFFLDFFEISFIILPLLAPVAEKLGIDLVWFGILMGVNMQTSFMHPPFGFALFYLRSVAPPTIRTTDIYWGAVPFVVIQVIMVALIIAFPSLVTLGLDRPVHTGQPTEIQLLMPQEDRSNVNRDDAADLFRQLQPSGQ
jgi:TRAP-type mannitol/chloroaromatic compound transport system permease large subunit